MAVEESTCCNNSGYERLYWGKYCMSATVGCHMNFSIAHSHIKGKKRIFFFHFFLRLSCKSKVNLTWKGFIRFSLFEMYSIAAATVINGYFCNVFRSASQLHSTTVVVNLFFFCLLNIEGVWCAVGVFYCRKVHFSCDALVNCQKSYGERGGGGNRGR